MKIIVFSDSHGNIANIKLVLGFAKEIKADAIIHCGDWDNLKSVEEVLLSEVPFYAVLGNADIHQDVKDLLEDKAKGFNEKFLKISLDNRKIGVIHNIKDLTLSDKDFDIIFCGHTHFRSESLVNGIRVVNPGTIHSIKPSFAVYDTGTNKVESLDL